MTRFARLMAATMAALFTGALAAPAYATGEAAATATPRSAPSATAAARRRARSSTTSTRTASATPASPASPASASGPTTTTTASTTPASPTTTPTRAAATRSPASTRRRLRRHPHLRHLRQERTACARSSRAAAAPATGPAPTRTPRPPAASPPATAAASAAATARSTRRATPKATGKDFGNYRKVKPKITVIKDLGPEQRRRPLRPQGRRRHRQGGRRRRRHGHDARRAGPPPGHRDRRGRHDLADYAASITCLQERQERRHDAHLRPRLGRRHLRRRDRLHDPQRAPGHRRDREADRSRRDERHELRLHGFAGAFSLADDGVKTITRVTPRDDALRRSPRRTATGYRLSVDQLHRRRQHDAPSPPAPRTSGSAAGEKVRCTFVNTKLVPGLQVVKDGPARGPPRRHDDVHVRGLATPATRRCTTCTSPTTTATTSPPQPVRAPRRRRRRPARGRRGLGLRLHDAGRRARDGRGGPGLQRRHGDRRGRAGHGRHARPTTTAPTSSTRDRARQDGGPRDRVRGRHDRLQVRRHQPRRHRPDRHDVHRPALRRGHDHRPAEGHRRRRRPARARRAVALALHPQGHGAPIPIRCPNTAKVTGVDVIGGPAGTVDGGGLGVRRPPPAAASTRRRRPPTTPPAASRPAAAGARRERSGRSPRRARLRGASGCV